MTDATHPDCLAMLREEIEVLNRDLAAEWKRNQKLLEEIAQLRGVIENYQKFTGGVNVQSGASDGKADS